MRLKRQGYGLAVPALAVVAALAAAGCGGSDDNTTTAGAPANTTTTAAQGGGGGGASTVNVSETEFKLDPSDPTVKAGKITFDVSNDGAITHNLEVEGPGGEEELQSDLAAGQSGTLTVDLSKPGKYEFYCPIDNHKQMGMEGTVTVQ